MSGDRIIIRGLEVKSCIGVPLGERLRPQTLSVDLVLYPTKEFAGMGDSLDGGVDYTQVALEVEKIAVYPSRNLIETLASDIVDGIFEKFPLKRVEVTIKKYILPHADWVAVTTFKEF